MRISIIGCGASGMTAAISAIRSGADPAQITIYEASDRPGRKILATGNGRCNLGNEYLDASCFYTSDKEGDEFLYELISSFSADDLKAFFDSLGIITVSKNGYLYPRSMQASSVLNALMTELNSAGVQPVYSSVVTCIERSDDGFMLKVNDSQVKCDRVIIASGLGSGGFEIKNSDTSVMIGSLLKDKNRFRKNLPALCGLTVSEDITSCAGVRAKGSISLYSDDEFLGRDEGELQFTKECISGIPVFQISRQASLYLDMKRPVMADIDLVPDMSSDELSSYIMNNIETHPDRKIYEILNGLINDKLAKYIYLKAGISGRDEVSKIPSGIIDRLITLCKELIFTVTGTESKEKAQTMCGGLSIEAVDQNCMLKDCRGAYVTGELLDIDGKCGGYNLYLAWATGLIAGRSAVK
ncbi:MAG: aminoacetone oxidase family FAD-binding enzyme [Lachnospiraceae bacterium]|nr:aminoacetone oxidase family FAD-binding enzyme [Lachnospiraceae bacterium]